MIKIDHVLLMMAVAILGLGCSKSAETKAEIDNYFELHIVEHDSHPGHSKEPANLLQNEKGTSPTTNDSSSNGNYSVPRPPDSQDVGQERSPLGFCDIDENRVHLYGENHVFAEHIAYCVTIDVFSLSAHLDTQCVAAKYDRMTSQCINCFADYTKCAAQNCVSDCAPWPRGRGKRSIECKKCSWFKCGDNMKKCTGLPLRRIPDFKRG